MVIRLLGESKIDLNNALKHKKNADKILTVGIEKINGFFRATDHRITSILQLRNQSTQHSLPLPNEYFKILSELSTHLAVLKPRFFFQTLVTPTSRTQQMVTFQ